MLKLQLNCTLILLFRLPQVTHFLQVCKSKGTFNISENQKDGVYTTTLQGVQYIDGMPHNSWVALNSHCTLSVILVRGKLGAVEQNLKQNLRFACILAGIVRANKLRDFRAAPQAKVLAATSWPAHRQKQKKPLSELLPSCQTPNIHNNLQCQSFSLIKGQLPIEFSNQACLPTCLPTSCLSPPAWTASNATPSQGRLHHLQPLSPTCEPLPPTSHATCATVPSSYTVQGLFAAS